MTPVKDLPPYLANFKFFFAKKEKMGLKAMKRIEGKPTGDCSEKQTDSHIHTLDVTVGTNSRARIDGDDLSYSVRRRQSDSACTVCYSLN